MQYLVRLLFVFFLLYVLYQILWKNAGQKKGGQTRGPAPKGLPEEMKKDPVCGTWVPASQALSAQAGGETHFFCSPACRDKYILEAEKK
jgi:uncharacterized protein